tara:strand:- start:32605 stop:33141 length:537 start_codon:yes stop_codon:yes gene_type:complete
MINQDLIDRLFDDVSYLEAEAEALKYLIDSIPYDEKPPEGQSIKEMLQLIDFAQHHYYRPIIERVLNEDRIIKLSDFNHFEESFLEYDNVETDIHKVLNKLIKHRVALLTIIEKIHPIDLEKPLKDVNKGEITLFNFIQYMVNTERSTLKEIADLILIYQNEKQYQREINKKMSQREL